MDKAKKFTNEPKRFTKVGNWHVEFSDEFMKELASLPPQEVKEVEDIVNDIADGSIDPTSIGSIVCSYCGIRELPLGVSICEECSIELR